VKFANDALYIGGRTGQSWYDSQMGDGKLIKLDAKSGGEIWSAFYFTGKGPDEMAEHRMKGLAVGDGKLYLVCQVYTGTKNGKPPDGDLIYWQISE